MFTLGLFLGAIVGAGLFWYWDLFHNDDDKYENDEESS